MKKKFFIIIIIGTILGITFSIIKININKPKKSLSTNYSIGLLSKNNKTLNKDIEYQPTEDFSAKFKIMNINDREVAYNISLLANYESTEFEFDDNMVTNKKIILKPNEKKIYNISINKEKLSLKKNIVLINILPDCDKNIADNEFLDEGETLAYTLNNSTTKSDFSFNENILTKEISNIGNNNLLDIFFIKDLDTSEMFSLDDTIMSVPERDISINVCSNKYKEAKTYLTYLTINNDIIDINSSKYVFFKKIENAVSYNLKFKTPTKKNKYDLVAICVSDPFESTLGIHRTKRLTLSVE